MTSEIYEATMDYENGILMLEYRYKPRVPAHGDNPPELAEIEFLETQWLGDEGIVLDWQKITDRIIERHEEGDDEN